ncbi:hypothetical protein MLD38_027069 [Melastoma candidum]|uniref:Uncharacterized protein n=1 Tax=Melastoma candidum TaxID=119954 RepID=A0ACB9P1L0_9MYRT|nr:hypothetical protein MLD38_027069 [Melastoma candidum]
MHPTVTRWADSYHPMGCIHVSIPPSPADDLMSFCHSFLTFSCSYVIRAGRGREKGDSSQVRVREEEEEEEDATNPASFFLVLVERRRRRRRRRVLLLSSACWVVGFPSCESRSFQWSDVAKKKHRMSLLAQFAAEETCRAEAMAVGDFTPLAPPPRNGVHECALCFGRAMTRCSRCKSVRYCSGKCQIIHWRQVHKQECKPIDDSLCGVPPFLWMTVEYGDASMNRNSNMDLLALHLGTRKAYICSTLSENTANLSDMFAANSIRTLEGRTKEKRMPDRLHRGMGSGNGFGCDVLEELRDTTADYSPSLSAHPTKEAPERHKARSNDTLRSFKQIYGKGSNNESIYMTGCAVSSSLLDNMGDGASIVKKPCTLVNGKKLAGEKCIADFEQEVDSSPTTSTVKGLGGNTRRGKPAKVITKASLEQHLRNEDGDTNSVGVTKDMKLMEVVRPNTTASTSEQQEKSKMLMLFPYEEFVRLFQHEAFEFSPRGLINCGNNCYANAVLQCLTCTKPLTVYLLLRSHSRNCHGKDWCLICELEQHVAMLKESGVPLSPSRILLHLRNMNRQIGSGSQEDAHEFLRLLIASMQYICLEGLGGEKKVSPRLQETTFVQHTFGGLLKSKVKCLQCRQESERYENILDLTLEIDGWVGSLEDALKKFTMPEHLEGENMYICGRCGSYVRARKQLRIHEAPNVLTIVLKRFQEGKYGKISKHISFPEMLDMVPFMTGTGDVPPLYMLYAVVVHLDTQNASFSGHYVSYVRNLRGTWFKIDDSVVQPVASNQVMSEGAYMLFYIRSCPRPLRSHNFKAPKQPNVVASKHCTSRSQSLQPAEAKPRILVAGKEHVLNSRGQVHETGDSNENFWPTTENLHKRSRIDLCDSTSSDWSLFTSSDEAALTTESTRDSFSTVDTDRSNADRSPSTHNPGDQPWQNPVPCRLYSSGKAQTSYVSEDRGYVLDSDLTRQHVNIGRRRDLPRKMDGSAGLAGISERVSSFSASPLSETIDPQQEQIRYLLVKMGFYTPHRLCHILEIVHGN